MGTATDGQRHDALPHLTLDQRLAALDSALHIRRRRADMLAEIRSGALGVAEVLDRRDDPMIAQTRMARLLLAVPGWGEVRTARRSWPGTQARQPMHELLDREQRKRTPTGSGRQTAMGAVHRFLTAMQAQNVSPETQRSHRKWLTTIAGHLGPDRPMAQIGLADAEEAAVALWGDASPQSYLNRRTAARNWWYAEQDRPLTDKDQR